MRLAQGKIYESFAHLSLSLVVMRMRVARDVWHKLANYLYRSFQNLDLPALTSLPNRCGSDLQLPIFVIVQIMSCFACFCICGTLFGLFCICGLIICMFLYLCTYYCVSILLCFCICELICRAFLCLWIYYLYVSVLVDWWPNWHTLTLMAKLTHSHIHWRCKGAKYTNFAHLLFPLEL